MTKIAVIGAGYVGLSTGVGLALLGHSVICIDNNQEKIETLQQGSSPISEVGMSEAIERCIAANRLQFTTEVVSVIKDCEFIFLCLPTPQGTDGSADLSFIKEVSLSIGSYLASDCVVVNKSTVPVGTTVQVSNWLGCNNVQVVSNPEFLRQGSALFDFLNPSRIVIGGDDSDAVERIAALYSSIDAPVLKMNAASAEALKYAANSFLATKLTFVNAIADICEVVGADIFDVVKGLGLDPRIGDQFLNPGPGWGGSCFPKDTRALVKIAEENGYDFALLRGVIQTNDEQYERIAMKVIDACGGNIKGKTVGAWGLTFKAHTDDLRDSPAIAILTILKDLGAHIRAYDSDARGVDQYPWIERCHSALDACDGVDALVVLTEWPEFAQIFPSDVKARMSCAVVVDARNVLDHDQWRLEGFNLRGIGR